MSSIRQLRASPNLLPAVMLAASVACTSNGLHVTAQSSLVEIAATALEPNRNLDVLFVIDTSWSMADERARLAANIPRFIDQLQNGIGGMPNLHIAVTSTDMGTLGNANPMAGCRERGDDGALHLGSLATTDGKPYLVDVAGDNGTRIRNYANSLQDAFTAMATFPLLGCGIEQPLNAMGAALWPTTPKNDFLREDANLAVVFITDEDDCSLSGTSVDMTRFQTGGACFRHAVVCDEDPTTIDKDDVALRRDIYPSVIASSEFPLGARTNCRIREDVAELADLHQFVEGLANKKGSARRVLLAGVFAPQSEISWGYTNNAVRVAPACTAPTADGTSAAAPAMRLHALLGLHQGPTRFRSVCDENFADVVADLGNGAARLMDGSCVQLPTTPVNLDTCTVALEAADQRSTQLANCRSVPEGNPCYEFVADARCTGDVQGRRLITKGVAPRRNSWAVARCERARANR